MIVHRYTPEQYRLKQAQAASAGFTLPEVGKDATVTVQGVTLHVEASLQNDSVEVVIVVTHHPFFEPESVIDAAINKEL